MPYRLKWITEDGRAPIANGFRYWKKDKSNLGEWLSKKRELVPCSSGYHVPDLTMMAICGRLRSGCDLWLVEVRGNCERGLRGSHWGQDDKEVWQQIRLIEKVASWEDCAFMWGKKGDSKQVRTFLRPFVARVEEMNA